MEKYIKVNAKVAKFLHLDTIRNAVKDGNYLLWMMDIQEFGSLTDIPQILSQIGGLLLTGAEAREEQDGVANRNLPVPTDKRFVLDSKEDDSAANEEGAGNSPESESSVSETGASDTGNSENSGNSSDSSDSDDPDLKQEGGNNE